MVESMKKLIWFGDKRKHYSFIIIEQGFQKDIKRYNRIMKMKWGDSNKLRFIDGVELHCLMGNYDHIIERYVDIFIQFGFLSFYIVAWPLSPVVLIVWNLIIMKVDVHLLTQYFKKKISENAVDIGPWMRVMEIFMIISIINNTLIMIISLKSFANEMQINSSTYFWMILGIEHFILSIMFILINWVKSQPKWVRNVLKLQYLSMKNIRKEKEILFEEELQRKINVVVEGMSKQYYKQEIYYIIYRKLEKETEGMEETVTHLNDIILRIDSAVESWNKIRERYRINSPTLSK